MKRYLSMRIILIKIVAFKNFEGWQVWLRIIQINRRELKRLLQKLLKANIKSIKKNVMSIASSIDARDRN